MPNGKHGDPLEFSDYESYFAPIAASMQEFAQLHGLEVEKYCHDAPLWSL